MTLRLHVHLRNLGLGSRRKAEELIAAGRVSVNGVVAQIGQQVSGSEKIEVDGHEVVGRESTAQLQYLLMNKPVGYTSTNATHFSNEQSVLELLPYDIRKSTQWQIVGRLDKNSEGLLVLTNDGQLCYVMTHPKFEIEKEYEVTLANALTSKEVELLQRGVTSGDGTSYRFKSVVSVGPTTYRVILTEGKKREIREAISILGSHVVKLVRIRLGELRLGDIKGGEFRELGDSEKQYLSELLKRVPNAEAK